MSDLEPIEALVPKNWRPPKGMTPDELPLSEGEELVLDLVEVGISRRKAEDLVCRFPYERIRQQLKWLPARGARKPASLLIVAIERDFDAPVYGVQR